MPLAFLSLFAMLGSMAALGFTVGGWYTLLGLVFAIPIRLAGAAETRHRRELYERRNAYALADYESRLQPPQLAQSSDSDASG